MFTLQGIERNALKTLQLFSVNLIKIQFLIVIYVLIYFFCNLISSQSFFYCFNFFSKIFDSLYTYI